MSIRFKTPILFIVFNRPGTTRKVFEKIREIRPQKLYVASDGPRDKIYGEKDKIFMVRKIATKIDWPCQVITLFREKNLGCKIGVSSAITWFFQQENQGIILEDDCVPHLDFFYFCENLLNRYSEDTRISAITGNNFQNGKWRGNASYYFSKFAHCWGWATWKRAWDHYQGELPFWLEWRDSSEWRNFNSDKVERNFWRKVIDKVYYGNIDSWAYSWDASRWYNGFLAATPNVNLVSNIGFGDEATHTKSKNSKFSKMLTSGLNPIVHPEIIERDVIADHWTFNYHYGGKFLRFPYNLIIFPYRLIGYVYRKIKFFLIK